MIIKVKTKTSSTQITKINAQIMAIKIHTLITLICVSSVFTIKLKLQIILKGNVYHVTPEHLWNSQLFYRWLCEFNKESNSYFDKLTDLNKTQSFNGIPECVH